MAEDRNLARGALAVALEDLDRGGLAGAVGPSSPNTSPRATVKSMPRTASTSP
jgi:hypothetical protein